MNVQPVNIAVIDNKNIVEAEVLRTAKTGKTVKVKAVANGKYLLAEGEQGLAPENITVKRVGKDLHVSLEGSDSETPDLIIENFFGQNGVLVGKAEDGSFYEYIATDAEDDHEAVALIDGESSALALGTDALSGLDGLIAPSGLINPLLLGLGGLAAIAAAIGVGYAVHENNKDNGNDNGGGNGGGGGGGGGEGGGNGLVAKIDSVTDNVGAQQGPLTSGGFTDDTTPTFNGHGTRPGNIVEILDNGKLIGTAVVAQDGSWSFTPGTPLPEGDHSFTVVEKDGKGNSGKPSDPFDLVIDLKAPGQASIDEIFDDQGSKTGPVANGGLTDDNTPTLKGKAEPFSTVAIFDNGNKIGEAKTDASGNWTFTPASPLADGNHSFTVVATDRAGNVGLPSAAQTIVIDTQAPDNSGIGEVSDNVGPVTGPIENGGSTDDKTPTIGGGGATPGDIVTIIDNGNPIGSVVVGDGGNWEFTPEDPLDEGKHEIGIIITDPAGNESKPSDPITIIVDTEAPTKPMIGAVNDDQGENKGDIAPGDITDDAQPTITGTAEKDSLVNIYDNGKLIGTARTDAEGNWTFTPDFPLSIGEHSLTVEAVDAAGNVSEKSDPFPFEIATGGTPSAPSIIGVIDDVGSVQGNVAKGEPTDDTRPTVHGSAKPGTIISVYDNGELLGTAVTGENGRWSFTPAADLAEGNHDLTVTATDADGKVSPETGKYPIVIDTTPPELIGENTLTDDVGAIQGPINNGDTTDDSTPTFGGVTEPGAIVIIRDNGEEIGRVEADADGNWSFTPEKPLAEGDHSLTVQPVDKAGNEGAVSAPIDFVVDTTLVEVSIINVVDDNGEPSFVQKGQVINDTTPTINGKATANALITIYDNGTLIGSAVANYKGEWHFTPTTPLAEGSHSFTATASKPGQGESEPTGAFDLIIDTTPPTNGGIGEISDDVGIIQGPVENGKSSDDTTPTLEGGGTPGDGVVIIDNGQIIGTAIVGDDGKWTFTPEVPLNDGKHEFVIIVTDPAGNISEPSDPYIVIVDTTPPEKPVIGEVEDNVGPVTGPIDNGGSTDDTQPTFGGGGSPGDVVTIIDNGETIGTAIVGDDGRWDFTPDTPLDEGKHDIGIIVTDPAGNESVPSDDYTIIIDTEAPVRPEIDSLIDNQGADQGPVGRGDTTDDAQPTMGGTAEANTVVKIYDNGRLIGSAPVNAEGRWEFTPSTPLLNGAHALTVEAVDKAGNVSEPSDSFDFNLAAGGTPGATAILGVTDDVGDVQGNIGKNASTDDVRPTVHGTAQPGSLVTLFVDGTAVGSIMAGTDGSWAITPDRDLAEGLRNLTASATDVDGNVGPLTGDYPIKIDTTPPEAITGDLLFDDVGVTGPIASGDTTDDATPTFSGKTEPGATVIIRDGDEIIGRVPADADGNWTFTPEKPLADGDHSLTAQPVDKAGNTGPQTAPIEFVVDTSAVAITITNALDDAGSVTGLLTSGAVTDDTTPTLNGTASANAIIHIYEGDRLLGTVVANYKGEWSFTPENPLSEGSHSFSATATNAAGTSEKTGDFTLIIDLTPPVNNEGIGSVTDDVGLVKGPIENGGSTDDTTPTFGGGGTPGDKVTIIDNGEAIGTAIVGDDGKWTFTPETPLNDDRHEFTTIVTDPAGNSSVESPPYTVIIDTEAPVRPVIDSLIDNQGAYQGPVGPGETTDDAQPTMGGTAEANTVVKIYDNGRLIGSAPVNAEGRWEFTPSTPLLNGAHALTVETVDKAGNVSAPSEAYDFTLAAGGTPGATAILGVTDDVGDVQGNIGKNASTDDVRPTVHGTALPGSLVTLFVDGNAVGSVMAGTDGSWAITPGVDLAEGVRNLTASATDADGNVGPLTGDYPIKIDTTPPEAITGDLLLDDVGVTGPIASGDTTDDATPTFSGKTEPGATVIIRDGDAIIGRVPADADGNWTFTPEKPLADGDHSLTAQPVDNAGNAGPQTAPIDFVVDTSAVAISIIGALDDVGAVQDDLRSGAVTDDTTPTLHGTASANAVIHIYEGTVLLGTTMANYKGEWSFTPETALAEGLHSFNATATNAAGTSEKTGNFNLIVDLTPPVNDGIGSVTDDVGVVQGPVFNGDETDDTTPTLGGDGVPGDKVTIVDNGEAIGTAIVGDDGKWTFTPETPLNDGRHEFTTIVTDPAGNSNLVSPPYVVIVDTQAGSRPVITEVFDAAGDATGAITSGDTMDDSLPRISGTADAGSIVKIYDNGVLMGSALVNAEGNWTFQPLVPMDNGPHQLTAIAADAAGNTTAPSEGFDFTMLTGGAPSAPAITSIVDDVGDIQHALQHNEVTDDARPTINGTAEPGSTVMVYADGNLLGSAPVNAEGRWSFTPSTDLAEGPHLINAEAVNAAGNTSPATGEFPIVVDTVAPGAISGQLLFDDVGVTGPIVSGGTTDDSTPTFSGSAEAGATVIISDNGRPIGSVIAAADGAWSYTPTTPLIEGNHSFSAQPVDTAGNKGPATTPIDFTVDTTAVEIAITQVMDDAGSITGPIMPGRPTDDTTPTINGKATPGGQVNIYDGATLLGTATARPDGGWSFTPGVPLSEGLHNLTATVTTEDGESDPTAAFALNIDTTAPGRGVIDNVSDDVGAKQGPVGNNGVTDDSTPTLEGRGTPGDKVSVFNNGMLMGEVIVNRNGTWSYTPTSPLNDGMHAFTIVMRDEAGNSSAASETYTITVDTKAPDAPTIGEVFDDVGASTGPVGNGGRTDDRSPELSGTAEPNTLVKIYNGTTLLGSVMAGPTGNWKWQPEDSGLTLGNGNYQFNTSSVDAAGNESARSPTWSVNVGTDTATGSESFSSYKRTRFYEGSTYNLKDGLKIFVNKEVPHPGTINYPPDWMPIGGMILFTGIISNNDPALSVMGGGQVSFTVPAASNFGFDYSLYSSSADQITIYGTSGNVLYSGRLGATGQGLKKFNFDAPGNELIAKVVYTSHAQIYTYIDNIQWGFDSASSSVKGEVSGLDTPLDDTAAALANDSSEARSEPELSADGKVYTLPSLSQDQVIDLGQLIAQQKTIETVDITGGGDNTLKVSAADILDLSNKDLFINDDKQQLLVKGDKGDRIELSDLLKDGADLGDWKQAAGTVTVAGEQYEVYQHSGSDVELLVQQGVQVDLNNH